MIEEKHDMVGVVPVHLRAPVRHELKAYRVRIQAKSYSDAIQRLLDRAKEAEEREAVENEEKG